jgi:hypothetical protein
MSDLSGPGDPAGDPGVAGDPALPPPPDDWLLRQFLQVRALAQHVNDMARLDAFAAAHDAATDGGGAGGRWGTTDDDPAALSAPGGAARQPVPASDPIAPDAVPPTAPPISPAAVAPPLALASDPAAPDSLPPDAASQAAPPSSPNLAKPTGLPSDPTPNSGSGPVQSAIDLAVPGAAAGREAGDALKAGNYGTAALKVLQGMAEAAIAIGTYGEGSTVLQGTRAVATKALSFKSFNALKSYLGSPGVGMQWHHIVEQSQIPQFGTEAIHHIQNVAAIPTEINQALNGIYSSKRLYTEGLTVREWLKGQSFAEQYEFGVRELGKLLGYLSE